MTCVGFSMENVRFMKPGDSHTQNGLLRAVNATGVLCLWHVSVCAIWLISKTRRPNLVFGIIYEQALNARLGVLEKSRSITDKI